ncbi:hypothetical protein BASA83_010286 [Batrachochytrium salamandrivorans]|nr:hypothetical protein BASA83_010286 [Batrachochytrium salamandrivorans]
MAERTHSRDERIIFWTAIRATSSESLTPRMFWISKLQWQNLDLHVLVHSTVLDKVFVQEADWPLIIADFLAGEDNVWIQEISEDWLELCKKELKNFRFRDNTFVRILNDGKSTATYMPSNDRIQVMKHYHESLAHLKYGSIIDLITRRFWWPDMKKDLKDYISRCPECQLNRSASRTHAPLPIRPVPPVALPFERWGIDFYGPMVETKSGIREMTEAAVAAFLYELMMTYGAPFEIISDRGKSFLAEGISEFERENSIRHLATTPYHPQTNGMVERMHAMLGHGLTTLVADKRDRWDEYLPQVLLAIRTRTHAVYWILAILFTLRHTPSATQRRNTSKKQSHAFG